MNNTAAAQLLPKSTDRLSGTETVQVVRLLTDRLTRRSVAELVDQWGTRRQVPLTRVVLDTL